LGGVDSNFINGDGLKYISENVNIRNITCIPNVKTQLGKKGISCDVIPIWGTGFKMNPLKLGPKIYSYIPHKGKNIMVWIQSMNLGLLTI
jgi:hypothetical protein